MSKKPTVLMILDGYGLNEKTAGNAVKEGNTPVMDKLMKEYPFVKGNASGLAVGLPEGQMGNSEVGHLNIGAEMCIRDRAYTDLLPTIRMRLQGRESALQRRSGRKTMRFILPQVGQNLITGR